MSKQERLKERKEARKPTSRSKLNPTNDKKKLIGELDTLWRKIINIKWGHRCAVCRGAGTQAHHFFGKKACPSVRWNTDNGVLLCFYDHIGKVHQQGLVEPVRDKLVEKLGVTDFEDLKFEAFRVHKFTTEELYALKQELTDELFELVDQGEV